MMAGSGNANQVSETVDTQDWEYTEPRSASWANGYPRNPRKTSAEKRDHAFCKNYRTTLSAALDAPVGQRGPASDTLFNMIRCSQPGLAVWITKYTKGCSNCERRGNHHLQSSREHSKSFICAKIRRHGGAAQQHLQEPPRNNMPKKCHVCRSLPGSVSSTAETSSPWHCAAPSLERPTKSKQCVSIESKTRVLVTSSS